MSNSWEREFERYAGIHKLNAFFGIEIDMEADISGAMRAIVAAIQIVQKTSDLAGKTRNTELIEAIADLRVELSQAKIAAANANDQIAELIRENRKLKEELHATQAPTEEKLVLGEKGLYYRPSGDGPFCTYCFDAKKQLIRLPAPLVAGLDIRRCPNCKTTFGC